VDHPAVPREARVLQGVSVYLVAAATVLIFGLNWPIMALGDQMMAPMWLAAFRLIGAAAIVVVVAAATGGLTKLGRQDVPVLLSVGLVRVALVNGLVFSALRFVPPGRASVLAYTASLWVLPIAALWLRERLTPLRVGGVAVGCLGLGLLLEPWTLDWSDTGTLMGLGMLLCGAVAMAFTTVHIRGHRWRATPFELMPWQLLLGALPTLVLAWALEGPPEVESSAAAVGVIGFQVVFASSFAMWGELTICRSLPAISASLLVMATPAVGLAASVLWTDETLTLAAASGFVLILAGACAGIPASEAPSDRAALEAVRRRNERLSVVPSARLQGPGDDAVPRRH
jgi:drug/metabolite transporter (DMT)-like permease